MDTLLKAIKDYEVAVEKYVKLSRQETKIRIEVQKARHAVKKAKEEMWQVEHDLLDVTNTQ